MNQRNIPELLAPAGGWPQLKAAVQNGADAIYMGGPLFNARIKAENFSHDDMKEAIAYAHARNVKVYITLNTLIKDHELFQAFSYVNFLYEAGADAVILQDLGLARLIRKYLPEMPIHLSTQGTVYNKWAVDTIKALGFCRVVPAREMSLKEIREFTAECHDGQPACEVEVFVHGALCMCYSGQCQMSRLLGGINDRSGNRGLCAQPCRLPYENEYGEKSFLLSPKDICMLEDIPALCEAGVDSFKIEGRLKSPQYVAIVTSIYRKYLDLYQAHGYVKVHAEDMQKLMQIFNRGEFSKGYLHGNPGRQLLSGESSKNQGIYVGKVKAVKKGSTLVDVSIKGAGIELGDGVEIRGVGVTGNVVTYRKLIGNGVVRIGDIKEAVNLGDKVYKVTEKKLLEEAVKSYENDFIRKIPVEMMFTASLGKRPVLRIRETDMAQCIQVAGEQEVEKARHKALDESRVEEQLRKLGDTVFEAKIVTVDLEEGISLPVSAINHMRRAAVEQLMAMKSHVERVGISEVKVDEIRRIESLASKRVDGASAEKNIADEMSFLVHVYSRDPQEVLDAKRTCRQIGKGRLCIPIELYMEGEYETAPEYRDVEVLPYILNVSKGNLDQYLMEYFDTICEKVRDKGLLIGNLGWIRRFQKEGVKIYGDYGLNVYNRQSAKVLEEMGVEVMARSHEAEMVFLENIPLMITEHPIPAREIEDRKRKKYTILQSCAEDKYLIFSKGAAR